MALLTLTTKALIDQFQQSAPVDVLGLAAAFGLEVWEDVLPEGISGKIFRDNENGGTSGFSIVVNSPEPEVRKRFTISHEIAHFLLHQQLIGSGIEDDALYRSKLSSSVEAEANRLAADILMPYPLLSKLQNSGIVEIYELARSLQVSQSALKIRLGIPIVD